jgi:hypothetical protein
MTTLNEIQLNDIVESLGPLTLYEEGKVSVVDGISIIARIKGVGFVPGGISRNNRLYTNKLWENVLANPDIMSKLKSRRIWGTIGHKTPINEESWAEGLISHILSDMYINENGEGICEFLVVNSKSGKNLKLMFDAMKAVNASPYVSSRATGKLESIKDNVIPKVNEDSYNFIGFDFVTDPGFPEANPKIVESLKKQDINIENYKFEEEVNMSDTMEKLLTEKMAAIKGELDNALDEIVSLKHNVNEKNDQIKKLEEEDASVMSDMRKKKQHWEDQEAAKRAKLKEDYDKKVDEEKEKISALQIIIDEYVELVGTVDECKTKLTTIEEEHKKTVETLKAYTECGTIEEVKDILKASEDLKSKMHVENLVKETGVDAKVLTPLIEAGMEDELIIKTIKDIEASKGAYEKFTDPTNADKDVTEDAEIKFKASEDVLEGLVQRFQVDIK